MAVDGYFFKKFRYKANDRRGTEREAPLVIGHSLVLLSKPEPADPGARAGWIYLLVYLFAGVVVALVLGVVGLTYWFRRSDEKVRRRLLSRLPEFALPPPDAPPVAPPVVAPVQRVNGPPPTQPSPRPARDLPGR